MYGKIKEKTENIFSVPFRSGDLEISDSSLNDVALLEHGEFAESQGFDIDEDLSCSGGSTVPDVAINRDEDVSIMDIASRPVTECVVADHCYAG